MSPLMKKVESAGKKGLAAKRKPYKIEPEDFFHDSETLRSLFAQLINSSESHRIAIIPSVSYGIESVVKNIPRKAGKVILAGEQFPSNVYPWLNSNYEVKFVAPPEGKSRGRKWNEKIIQAIDADTVAVSIGHVHWADGTLFDLQAIRAETTKKNAALIIDGTQSVGALPIDIDSLRPDALICAGYKWLMGPYAIGLAYMGEMFDDGNPLENNWINRKGAENFGGLINYQEQYLPGALRYDVGEHSNFIAVPMMVAAVKQLLKWKPDNIQEYCKDLLTPIQGEIQEMGYKLEENSWRSSHLFGIRLPKNTTVDKLVKQLKNHRVKISVRGDSMRIAPHVYNDSRDMQRLLSALQNAIE